MNANRRVLTEAQAAEYVSMSKHTLRSRRFKSLQPNFLKVGRSIRYLQADLDSFVEACRIDTTPQR